MSTHQKTDRGIKVKTNVKAEPLGDFNINHNQTRTGSEPGVIADLPLSDGQAEATKGGENLTLNGSGSATDDGPTTNIPIKIKRPTK